MHESSSDTERLNPRRFIDHLKHVVSSREIVLDEVFVRRAISALFFSLFNYWAIKSYARGKRGNGPLRDSFPLSAFFEDLLRSGLDYAIYPLFVYRVGADHYTLNPTTVVLISKPWKGRQENVNISYSVLEKLIELSYDILDYLERY